MLTHKFTTHIFSLVAGAVVLSLPLAAQPRYVIEVYNQGISSSANGINSLGAVTGSYTPCPGCGTRAWRAEAFFGDMNDLGTLGGFNASGNAINDVGQVTGGSTTSMASSFPSHAFRSTPFGVPAVLTDLGVFSGTGFSMGRGINNSGQVTGQSVQTVPPACVGFGSNPAFRTTSTGTISGGDNLGTLLTNNCRIALGIGINDSGVVVGNGNTVLSTAGTPNHAIRATGASVADIHPADLNYPSSTANAVNNAGQVVGQVIDSSGVPHAFRTAAGQSITVPQDLIGDLGGGGSGAFGINNYGDVVGAAGITATERHAFLYTKGTMYDLNNMVGTLGTYLGATLVAGAGINSQGQIVANGTVGADAWGFRLTPADVFIQTLIDGITIAVASGDLQLTKGQLASFIGKWKGIKESIQEGEYRPAINQANALKHEIDAQLKAGKMLPDAAAAIVEVTNWVIMALS